MTIHPKTIAEAILLADADLLSPRDRKILAHRLMMELARPVPPAKREHRWPWLLHQPQPKEAP